MARRSLLARVAHALLGDDAPPVATEPRRLLPAPSGEDATRMTAGNGLDWMNGTLGYAGASAVRTANPQEYKGDGATIRVKGFNEHPVVSACIRVIVDQVAQIPWVVKDAPGEDGTAVGARHPLQLLLDNPGKRFTARQLRARVGTDIVGYGNSLLQIARRSNGLRSRPVGLRALNAEAVQTVWVDEAGDPARWDVSDWNGLLLSLPVEDVLHFRDLDMPRPYVPDVFGYPRGAAAIQSIIADLEATSYVRQTVTNDGTPTLALLGQDHLTQADALAMQNRYVERAVSRGNRGRPAVFAGVKDIKALGFTLHDLEFPDLRRVSREDICAAFGVDPRMIGIASASNDAGLSGAQYQEARSRLIQHTVEPLLGLIVDELNAWLAPEFGNVVIDYDREVLRDLVEDDKATSERVRAEMAVPGLLTLEEGRAALRRKAQPEVTDTILMTLGQQLVPVAAAILDPTAFDAAKQAAAEADGASDTDGAEAGDAGDEPTDQPGGGADESQRSLDTREVTMADPRRAHWERQIKLLDADEVVYARAATAQFRVERAGVGATYAKAGETAARAQTGDPNRQRATSEVLRDYAPGGQYHEEWRRRFEELIGRTYRAGTAAEMVGTAMLDFQLPNVYVERAIAARAARLADYVCETTARQIVSVVQAAERAGLSVADTGKLIQQAVFGEHISDTRARTIARTESAGAMSQGQWDQAREAGVYQSKEWLAFADDETRETHRACMAQGRIAINEPFAANGMQFPLEPGAPAGEVIQCRCRPIFYVEAAGEPLL